MNTSKFFGLFLVVLIVGCKGTGRIGETETFEYSHVRSDEQTETEYFDVTTSSRVYCAITARSLKENADDILVLYDCDDGRKGQFNLYIIDDGPFPDRWEGNLKNGELVEVFLDSDSIQIP